MDQHSWASSTSRLRSSSQQTSDDVSINEQTLHARQQTDHCRGSGVMRTLIPGSLTILSAYPVPPFDIRRVGVAPGLVFELIPAGSGGLSLELGPLAYT